MNAAVPTEGLGVDALRLLAPVAVLAALAVAVGACQSESVTADSVPDAAEIVFVSDADGGNLRQLTDNDTDDRLLLWS